MKHAFGAVIGSILARTTSKSRLCRLLTTTPPLPSATAAMVVVSSIYLEYFGPHFTTETLAGDDFLWKADLHALLPQLGSDMQVRLYIPRPVPDPNKATLPVMECSPHDLQLSASCECSPHDLQPHVQVLEQRT